jgi:hypothetical protein
MGIEQTVLNETPAHPASKALAHISYVLATTDEDRKKGFSMGIPQKSVFSKSCPGI